MARDIYSWKGGTGAVPFKQQADGTWAMCLSPDGFYWNPREFGRGQNIDHLGRPVEYYENVLVSPPDEEHPWGVREAKIFAIEWRDKYEFAGGLRGVSSYRGRSAANIKLRDRQGNTYWMTDSEFIGLTWLPTTGDGYFMGRFTFEKKGDTFHLILSPGQLPDEDRQHHTLASQEQVNTAAWMAEGGVALGDLFAMLGLPRPSVGADVVVVKQGPALVTRPQE